MKPQIIKKRSLKRSIARRAGNDSAVKQPRIYRLPNVGKAFNIPVAKPFMPPIAEYEKYLAGIWHREYLTNNGPLVQDFEKKIAAYLGVENMLFVSNGTTALQIALKALKLEGEIITTPFSFVATTSSIVWEGCTPVFVDIEPGSLNIDASRIEQAITEKTSAILATHVFGNPCQIDQIQAIADRYKLKVIYDAAHCFGSRYKDKSVFEYGDITITSFHSTKLYHTIEGGGIFSKNPSLMKSMMHMRNFGHDGPGKFNGVGINGKNSEFHAAMGLCNLGYADQILERRKTQSGIYDVLLQESGLKKPLINDEAEFNYAYYPVIFDNEQRMLDTIARLENHGISPRRYFYPSLNELPYAEGSCPVSEDISRRILCLPLYHDLSRRDQSVISQLILDQ